VHTKERRTRHPIANSAMSARRAAHHCAPLQVCHDCDFRACGNPAHLWAGTQRDNMMDAIRKGRFLAVAPGELHPLAKLTDEAVRDILTSPLPNAALAEIYGVTENTIYSVRARRTWRHVELTGPEMMEAEMRYLTAI
jgi:hypothetical protein